MPTIADMTDKKDADTCSYSGCDRPIERQGRQGGPGKLYCSASCRTRANRDRRRFEDEHPTALVRRAAMSAHDALDGWEVDLALDSQAVPREIRHNFVEARRVLAEIVDRVPKPPE